MLANDEVFQNRHIWQATAIWYWLVSDYVMDNMRVLNPKISWYQLMIPREAVINLPAYFVTNIHNRLFGQGTIKDIDQRAILQDLCKALRPDVSKEFILPDLS